MSTPKKFVLALLATTLLTSSALAELWMPSVFSDHMVVQRDMPIAVWGTAKAGNRVTVQLITSDDTIPGVSEEMNLRADAQGRWQWNMNPISNTTRTWDLVVKEFEGPNGEDKEISSVTIKDILVGEVWLCGGQSNMEWSMNQIGLTRQQKSKINNPRMRLIKAPHVLATEPQKDITARWEVCTPETVGNWTAVGYYFGTMLQEDLDVPIGLISSNWGGTRIEPWIERADLAAHPTFAERTAALQSGIDQFNNMDDKERTRIRKLAEAVNQRNGAAYWKHMLSEDPGTEAGWMKSSFDDSSWPYMSLPGEWEKQEPKLAKFDGTVWFRKTIQIPSNWAQKDLILNLGRIDDSDTTFFNGKLIGTSTNAHTTERNYEIPAELVKAGSAVIAVCALDPHGAGGLTGPRMRIHPVGAPNDAIDLRGEWHWHKGFATTKAAPSIPATERNPGMNPQALGTLHDAMISPFVPYTMRGAIWYQGESNSGQPDEYRELMPLLIESWREDFGDHLAFGIVQLAAYKATSDDPDQGGWAHLRDAQLHAAQTVPSTGLAVTTDVGNANDIHPKNKKAVGDRLAGWALHDVYGVADAVPSSPIQSSASRSGNAVLVTFDHVQGGLESASGGKKIGGFALAGADGRFFWAQAELMGKNQVRVWSNDVPNPHIVNYGWQNNPVRANLINSAGLPASPFRADITGGSSGR